MTIKKGVISLFLGDFNQDTTDSKNRTINLQFGGNAQIINPYRKSIQHEYMPRSKLIPELMINA